MRKKFFMLISIFFISFVFSNNVLSTEWTDEANSYTNWLFDVWGTSTTNVYAVGNEGRIFHYDGWSSPFLPVKTAANF